TREPKADDHLLMKAIAENVEAVGEADLTRHDTLRGRIDDYLEMSSVFAVDDTVRLEPDFHRMFTWLLVPFLIAGILINYIPYKFVGRTAKRLTSHPVQAASFKLGLGVAVFSGWYMLLTAIFALTVGGFLNTLLFILVMLFSSYAVNNYLSQFKLYLLSSLWPGSKKPLDILKMIRDQLIEELNSFRVR
ncbi:MAG: hypothetical protein J5J00_14275, partial [Deltaproteobacteria bacterium]|nr:hypothetical protein [Deltaproteobacteria bacterium]